MGSRIVAISIAAALALPIAYGSASSSSFETTEKAGFEERAVVEVELANRDEVDRLVETGADLMHEIDVHDGHIGAQVMVTPSEAADLRAQGFDLGKVLWTAADSRAVLAQRREVIRENRQEARAVGIDATGYTEPVTKPSTKQPQADELQSADQSLAAVETDQLVIADYFQSSQGHFISVEAKTDLAQTATLTLEWDEGPGTPIGSGGSINMQSFVDAGTYMYHRRQIGVDDRPEYIRVTSSGGASETKALEEWLPLPEDDPGEVPLLTGFVDHYMDATELMDRFEQLAAEFPKIAEIVELPNKTNGYRRKAQATIGSTGGGGAAAIVVESLDWGHEGGNNISVEFLNPGAPNSPLSVSVVGGTLVRVTLATDATGALTSTAAQVVSAINASGQAGQIVRSFNYRGSAGAGIVQPTATTVQLSDFLDAPGYVSREPFQNKLLRIGKFRNGTRPGVLAYSQEHAREWQTPLVTTEFAERLLRNYAHNKDIKKLVNQHEIFVAPSINPDGSHYSFYDDGGQRRTMTRHCDDTNGDPGRRNDWGVDTNRNYPTGSRFDGFSGASASCISDTYW